MKNLRKSKNNKHKKSKQKKGITWKDIILSSFLFAVISFFGITCFIGEIRNQIFVAQREAYLQVEKQQALENELQTLRKKVSGYENAEKQKIETKQQPESKQKNEEKQKEKTKLTLSTLKNIETTYPIVKIKYNNQTFTINSQSFIYNSNIHTHLNNAFLYSRNDSLEDRLKITNKLILEGFSHEQAFYFMFGNLEPRIKNIFSVVEHESQNASVKFFPELKNMFQYIPEINKVEVNKEAFFEDFINLLNTYTFTKTKNNVLNIKTIETKPQFTVENLQQNSKLISSFSTSFAGGQTGRIKNIEKALSFVNGVVLQPNEVFSFNARTSPHTLENGYSTAKIIENGKFVDGVGGGICQASTTLYNAVVMADLEVKQVQNHSLPIGYVKLPFDAMVSTGSDLVFKNNKQFPIYLKAFTTSTDACVEVYGTPFEDGLTLKRKSVLIETLEATEPIVKTDLTGEFSNLIKENGGSYTQKQALSGYVYEGYIQYFKNNKLIEEKLVRKCKYLPQKAIVYVES